MQSFDVYFAGQTLPDADPVAVRQGVARLFKARPDAVERLFSGKPTRIKQGVDADAASLYRAAFRDVGALVEIVPAGAPPAAAKAPRRTPQTPAAEDGTQTPARPAVAEGVAGASLAEPGAIIDPTPPPPAAQIDTSALEALPPNTGTLEDCRVEKPHREIPDINHLALADE